MAMSRDQQDDQAKAMGRLIAKAWSDDAFKQRLLADPARVAKAEGVVIPEGSEVRVVENTDKLVHLTLPAKPAELSDEPLDVGGYLLDLLQLPPGCSKGTKKC